MKNMGMIIITWTLTVLAISTSFAIGEALAECKAGKVEVVVTNSSGKAKAICVSEEALPGITEAAENSALTFEVACPCFTLEQVEAIDGFRDDNGDTLEDYYYYSNINEWGQKWALISEVDRDSEWIEDDWMAYALADGEMMECHYFLEIDNIDIEEVHIFLLTQIEVDACFDLVVKAGTTP